MVRDVWNSQHFSCWIIPMWDFLLIIRFSKRNQKCTFYNSPVIETHYKVHVKILIHTVHILSSINEITDDSLSLSLPFSLSYFSLSLSFYTFYLALPLILYLKDFVMNQKVTYIKLCIKQKWNRYQMTATIRNEPSRNQPTLFVSQLFRNNLTTLRENRIKKSVKSHLLMKII